jgi:hypothetical protein
MKKNLRKVHEIIASPGYQGQEIHLQESNDTEESYNTCDYYEDESSDTDTETVNVILGSITSTKSVQSLNSYPNKILATMKINDHHDMKMKVDTGADICVLTTDDLQQLPLTLDIKPCHSILKSYGEQK